MKHKSPRSYRMVTRAESAERTGERILDAMFRLFAEVPYDRLRLEDVAELAGVTVQTVIRRFGSKHELLGATVEREFVRLAADRAAAVGASPEHTIEALVCFYERNGILILKLYAEAHQAPGVPELAARGRAYHVAWCREAFAAFLGNAHDDCTRQRRLAQVTAICDATTWRILRFDGRLSPEQTAVALVEMLGPLLSIQQPETIVARAPAQP